MSNNGERAHSGVKRVLVIHGPNLDLLGRYEPAMEEFRKRSFISAVATGIISGFGIYGYHMAFRFLSGRLRNS